MLRTDDINVWHNQARHLGLRALVVLVKHARNINIAGLLCKNKKDETILCLKCKHYAIIYAERVTLRQAPERKSLRLFYCIL